MSIPKLPIEPLWVEHILVPFLRYAFSSTLPYDADLTPQVQRAIAFCLVKPDYPTDGDDLLFERVFMAILHRYKDLAPDLILVTANLEPLAKFLIRRAQLKGPFKLLERSHVASDAWVEYEEKRIACLVEQDRSGEEGTHMAQTDSNGFANPVHGSLLSARPAVEPPKAAPTEAVIDPRLLHAQPGQYIAPGLSATIAPADDEYYRRQNRLLEGVHARNAATSSWVRQLQAAATPVLTDLPQNHVSGVYANHGSPYQQQHTPSYAKTLEQHLTSYPHQTGYRPIAPAVKHQNPVQHSLPAQAPKPSSTNPLNTPTYHLRPPRDYPLQPLSFPTSLTTPSPQRADLYSPPVRVSSPSSFENGTGSAHGNTYPSFPVAGSEQAPRGFGVHPGFSNIVSSFPVVRYGNMGRYGGADEFRSGSG
ncbi:hypothetical protein P153DRAFT_411588 [Dothidotthia symphoricarpi CBS 119687]|uniref:Uncharacterized protein n=1 Tax=Dothidotthia symphoricarpi CBS 119687 TaxID=1392245 RepID=A0A6A6A1C5_9PLEO|nr:uncharacterized protein P153DRAFT_411588 [Dothidotthia symphoricarpi CBS 119687]KAF2124518.1 hypothetical protein P153DRAFT_411588 [Dothidotthia symphoricarpi CBS 119687]